ncbi:MAG: hypothetical protein LBD16_08570 [Oscillospiraceae bacterium]|jgi:hypothetical protein|nr:hypothetical protein [Oscillospiraceae bacterium]
MKSNLTAPRRLLSEWANSSAQYAEHLERLDLIECVRNRSEIPSSAAERPGGRNCATTDIVSRTVMNEEMLTNIENISKAKLAELRELRRYADALIADEFGGAAAKARDILLAFYRDKQPWESIAKSNRKSARDVRVYEERIIARIVEASTRPPYHCAARKRINNRMSAYHLLSARTNLILRKAKR